MGDDFLCRPLAWGAPTPPPNQPLAPGVSWGSVCGWRASHSRLGLTLRIWESVRERLAGRSRAVLLSIGRPGVGAPGWGGGAVVQRDLLLKQRVGCQESRVPCPALPLTCWATLGELLLSLCLSFPMCSARAVRLTGLPVGLEAGLVNVWVAGARAGRIAVILGVWGRRRRGGDLPS